MKSMFISNCVESERGWGSRPDGKLFARTLEIIEKEIKNQIGFNTSDIYSRYDAPKECFFEDKDIPQIDRFFEEREFVHSGNAMPNDLEGIVLYIKFN